ncbi:MNIO family bufferin maturase [Nitrospira sp. Kam-Ns4a]
MPGQVPGPIPARAGIGLRSQHFRTILETAPPVVWVETHPENYFGDGGAPLRILERIRTRYSLSFHGVGLSLGSADPIDRAHLLKLKVLADRFEPAFVSEHLSWSSIGGRFLNELLPLPYTPESLDHICARIQVVQEALRRPLVIENVTRYLTWRDSTIPEGAFMAEVARRTGCGILLDLNNVYVNAINFRLDPLDCLSAFPGDAVWEIHLAGFDRFGIWLIDTHGQVVHPEVWKLYQWTIERIGPRPTLVEWDTNLPPLSVLVDQAKQADTLLNGYHAAAS